VIWGNLEEGVALKSDTGWRIATHALARAEINFDAQVRKPVKTG
jgi:hypothetical protein